MLADNGGEMEIQKTIISLRGSNLHLSRAAHLRPCCSPSPSEIFKMQTGEVLKKKKHAARGKSRAEATGEPRSGLFV